MALPDLLAARLRLPLICAPMYLISGPELVIAASGAGIVGSFPALNCRSAGELDSWLAEVREALAGQPEAAPFAVNLIVHRSNRRLEEDLAACVRHRVPLVITSLGAVPDLVREIRAYGGMVFHDVIHRRHAEKAAEAGVDGLVLVSWGAGGHAGRLNPFALLAEVRPLFDGLLALAGCLSRGRDVVAARAMGADLAYMGTRFIATRECRAPEAYKRMLLEAHAGDVVYTALPSGIPGNFLRASLERAGIDAEAASRVQDPGGRGLSSGVRPWRDIWSAGQGVAAIDDIIGTAELVDRLEQEYREALAELCGD